MDRIAARLYLKGLLASGQTHPCDSGQSHYLGTVLRLKPGAMLAVFDGQGGVFSATIAETGKKTTRLEIGVRLAVFIPSRDVTLCFAPLKRDHTDWLVQKATELGVRRLVPVITERTEARRVNAERLRAIAIEAAEQSERHDIPEILPPVSLPELLGDWRREYPLYACIERDGAGRAPIAQALVKAAEPLAFLTGPEGGFTPVETTLLARQDFVHPVSLGPLILRAETAGLAALAVAFALLDKSATDAHI